RSIRFWCSATRGSGSRPTSGPTVPSIPGATGSWRLSTSPTGSRAGAGRWELSFWSARSRRRTARRQSGSCTGSSHPTGRARPAWLELSALCTWRDVHGERFANGNPAVESDEGGFVFEGAYRVEGEGWHAAGEWYRGVRAREEAARGLNDREDLWAAGTFRIE